MVLFSPLGQRMERFVLTSLCLLVCTPMAMAQSRKRVQGGTLHVVGTRGTSASEALVPKANGSVCLSVSAAAQLQRAGGLNGLSRFCPTDSGSSKPSGGPAGDASRGQTATIEPWPLAENAAASQINTAGFSGFLTAPSYPTFPAPASSVTTVVTLSADFLQHGRKDLITLDSSAKLHLLANQGDGSFALPITSNGRPTGSYYTTYLSAFAYDYDKDGYPDVVARDGTNSRLTFFHNNQDGTFTLAKSIQLPNCYYPAAMLLGDVNQDGIPDITAFVTSYDYSTSATDLQLLVYAGDGSGYFNTTPVETDYVFAGGEVVIPNDGAVLSTNATRPSLYFEALSLNSYGINGATVVALGLNGDGTFAATPYAQQDFPSANTYANTNLGGLSLADLNNDGIPDITMSFMDGNIYTALGASDGSFPTVLNAAAAVFLVTPQSWAVTDIDGDGFPDFVAKEQNSLEVLPGLGTGLFGGAKTYYTASNSNSGTYENSPGSNLVVDDFNADGILDAIYVDGSYSGYQRAIFLQGHGDDTFQAPAALPAYAQLGYAPGYLHAQAVFDSNGDGRADVILQDTYGAGPYPYRTALSDGKGGFKLVQAAAGQYGNYTLESTLASGDFNHDGLKDLVVDVESPVDLYTVNHTLAVLLSKGDGTFADPVFIDMNGTALNFSLTSVSLGDINGDGTLDMVATTTGGYYDAPAIITILGNKDGTFQPAVTQPFGTAYTFAGATLADFNGDGKLDLFLSDDGAAGGTLPSSSIIFGDNSGSFATAHAVSFTSGLSLRKVLVGDLNGDGKPDLALIAAGVQSGYSITATNRGLLVYLNNGDGTFAAADTYEVGSLGGDGLLADVNGDGTLDVVFTTDYSQDVASTSNAGAQLLLGHGDGTFGAPSNLMLPASVSLLASGDLNGTGLLDLVTFSYFVGPTTILRNQSGTTLTLTADEQSITQGSSVTFTATVQPAIRYRPEPTGSVKFLYNGQTLGVAQLQAGSASLAVTSLPIGSDSVTAVYEGDTNYSSTANGATVAIAVAAAPPVPADFVLNAPSGAISIPRGSNASLSFSVLANAGFNGTVAFAAENLPKGMSVNFAPASVRLSPGGTATEELFISTTASNSTAAAAGVFGLPFLGSLLLLGGSRRRLRRAVAILLVSVGSLAALVSLSGCGGSAVSVTATGDYTIVVQATPSVSGVSAKSFNVTVRVD
jgi:hypothetical protein